MALTLRPVPGKEKSRLICQAFAQGAPKSAEGDVFFGTEGQLEAFRKAKSSGRPWFYCDNSYFDKHRGIYFRVTKNALQCSGTGESDGSRFKRLNVEIKPWRENLGRDILVVPQSDLFMKSVLGFTHDWAAETVATLARWGITEHVRVRPWVRDKVKAAIALQDDLKNLRLLITHSSASAITALLEGVPATSVAGAANALTGGLTEENVLLPKLPSYEARERFAWNLAEGQFTLEEMRDGKAWKCLNE